MKKKLLLFLLLSISLNSISKRIEKWVILTKDFPTNISIKAFKFNTKFSLRNPEYIAISFTDKKSEKEYMLDTFLWKLIGNGWEDYNSINSYSEDFLGWHTIELKTPLYYKDAQENAALGKVKVLAVGDYSVLEKYPDAMTTYSKDLAKAAKKNAEAQYYLYKCLIDGNGVGVNKDEAKNYLKKSADNGFQNAISEYGFYLMSTEQYNDAIPYLKQTISDDNAYTALYLAYDKQGNIEESNKYAKFLSDKGYLDFTKILFQRASKDAEKVKYAEILSPRLSALQFLKQYYINNNRKKELLTCCSTLAKVYNDTTAIQYITKVAQESSADISTIEDALYYNIYNNNQESVEKLLSLTNLSDDIVYNTALRFKEFVKSDKYHKNLIGSEAVIRLYKLGNEKGFAKCSKALANYYNNDKRNILNSKEATLSIYKNLADKGDAESCFHVYKIYSSNVGVKQNMILANSYLNKGGNLGDQQCLTVIAERKKKLETEKLAKRERENAVKQVALAKKYLSNLKSNNPNGRFIYNASKNTITVYMTQNTIRDYTDVTRALSDRSFYNQYKAAMSYALFENQEFVNSIDRAGAVLYLVVKSYNRQVSFTWQ